MATSTIKPKRGTTAQWEASKRILEFNEWGVEETVTGEWVLRVGDGEHEFLELPKVIDTPTLSAMVAEVRSKYDAFLEEAANEYERFEEISADIDAKHAEVIALGGQLQSAYDKSIAAVNSRIDRNDKRITNLERGLPDESFVIDNTVEYAKEVPSNALPYAEIAEIGGMTHRVNVGTEEAPEYVLRSTPVTEVEIVGVNLFDLDDFANKNGFVAQSDGSYKGSNLFKDIWVNTNKKAGQIFLSYEGKTENSWALVFRFYYTDGTSSNEAVIQPTSEFKTIVFSSNSNLTVEKIAWSYGQAGDYYVKNMMLSLVDTEYTPYVRNTLPIHDAIQNLDGYGWGINADCYNYIDWEKKQFVKRVGCVDLGTLDWGVSSNSRFIATLTNVYSASGVNEYPIAIMSADYVASTGNGYNAFEKSFYITTDGRIAVKDTAYTDAASFKAAMSGVMLYYELAEPVITDISDLLPDDNLIGVEGGGTVTMVNEYGYDVPSEVVYQVESEVVSE